MRCVVLRPVRMDTSSCFFAYHSFKCRTVAALYALYLCQCFAVWVWRDVVKVWLKSLWIRKSDSKIPRKIPNICRNILGLLFDSWQYRRNLRALSAASLFSLRFHIFWGVKDYFWGLWRHDVTVSAGTLKTGQWLAQREPQTRPSQAVLVTVPLSSVSVLLFPSKVKCLVLTRASANSWGHLTVMHVCRRFAWRLRETPVCVFPLFIQQRVFNI